MTLTTISPSQAQRMINEGALLIDIRGADEYGRERIACAVNMPMDQLSTIDSGGKPVIYHCKAGNRTAVNAAKLATAVASPAYVLEGGIEHWKKSGLPVKTDQSQPIEIMRQVQITAGSLVLTGVVLSQLVSPAYVWLSAFIGAGLLFAGLTGWCGMAKMFSLMPWNRTLNRAK